MIRPGAAILAVILLAGLPAWAQTALVRSGEHPTYSRLVVPVPTGSTWEIAENGRSVSFGFAAGAGPFDLSEVFTRIPRTRLAGLNAEAGTLALELACDCPVTAFLHQDRFAVIDIADPPVETALGRAAPPAGGPLRQDGPAGLENGTLDWFPTTRPAVSVLSLPGAGGPDIGALADAIGAELSRAAAAGLLEAAEPVPVGPAGAPPDPRPVPDPGATVPLPITVRTAHDDAAGPPDLRQAADCPAPAALAVADWGGEAGFAAGLGALRAGTIDARDRLDPGGVRRIARFYIHHGFGAEAEAWLDTLDDAPAMERALAAFFDDRPAPLAALLADHDGCLGAVPMWRVAAGDPGALDEPAAREALVAGFTAAPLSLRRLIAPSLVEALAGGPHADLLAEIDANLGRAQRSEADPDSVAPPPAAPSRLEIAAALTAQLTQPGAAAEGTFDAAEALWRELGAGPEVQALAVALVAAAARDGDLPRALRLQARLAEADPRHGRQAAVALVAALAAADRASGLELVAAGGLDLGRGPEADAARLAAATALAGAARPDTALQYLTAIPAPRTAEAEALMTELLFGDPTATGAAGTGLEAPGRADAGARLAEAWRTGAWDIVVEIGSGARAEAAAALLASDGDPDGARPAADFAALETLLTDSAGTRALVESLLDEAGTPPPD